MGVVLFREEGYLEALYGSHGVGVNTGTLAGAVCRTWAPLILPPRPRA